MERIGIAASKIAKNKLWLYNVCVILISFLFSLFIFILAGSAVVLSLLIIGHGADQLMAVDFEKELPVIVTLCMVTLTVIVVFFNILAILRNIKFRGR